MPDQGISHASVGDNVQLKNLQTELQSYGYPYTPKMSYAQTDEAGPQIEQPQVKYPGAMLPYVDQTFAVPYTNDGTFLSVTPDDIKGIQLFRNGVDETQTPAGLWYPATPGDTTLQESGAPVFESHTFVGVAQTISYEGLAIKGGDPLVVDPADPLLGTQILDDGPGSMSELLLQFGATRIGLVMQWAGDRCPRWQGNLASNGDRGQLIGGGRHSLSLPNLPFTPWTRPAFFGSRSDFSKLTASLVIGTTIGVVWPAGSSISPEDVPKVYQLFRIRLFGIRVCGNYGSGCPVVMPRNSRA